MAALQTMTVSSAMQASTRERRERPPKRLVGTVSLASMQTMPVQAPALCAVRASTPQLWARQPTVPARTALLARIRLPRATLPLQTAPGVLQAHFRARREQIRALVAATVSAVPMHLSKACQLVRYVIQASSPHPPHQLLATCVKAANILP